MKTKKQSYDEKYYMLNKIKKNKYDCLYHLETKLLIFQIYSKGKMNCNQCGYDNIDALSIDHIKGNGYKHRTNIGCSGQPFYHWIINNMFPNGYQILCMNCQLLKRLEGSKI